MRSSEIGPSLGNSGEFFNGSAFDSRPKDDPMIGRTVHELLSMQPFEPNRSATPTAGTTRVLTTGTGHTEGPRDFDTDVLYD